MVGNTVVVSFYGRGVEKVVGKGGRGGFGEGRGVGDASITRLGLMDRCWGYIYAPLNVMDLSKFGPN